MKSEIKRTDKEEQEQAYPCLKEYVGDSFNNFVVLFVDKNIGTVVYEGESLVKLGKLSTTWYSADNQERWKDFKGEVILKN